MLHTIILYYYYMYYYTINIYHKLKEHTHFIKFSNIPLNLYNILSFKKRYLFFGNDICKICEYIYILFINKIAISMSNLSKLMINYSQSKF